jgi:hypothetical protein
VPHALADPRETTRRELQVEELVGETLIDQDLAGKHGAGVAVPRWDEHRELHRQAGRDGLMRVEPLRAVEARAFA